MAKRNHHRCAFKHVGPNRAINCKPTRAIHCCRSTAVRSQCDFLAVRFSSSVKLHYYGTWRRTAVSPGARSISVFETSSLAQNLIKHRIVAKKLCTGVKIVTQPVVDCRLLCHDLLWLRRKIFWPRLASYQNSSISCLLPKWTNRHLHARAWLSFIFLELKQVTYNGMQNLANFSLTEKSQLHCKNRDFSRKKTPDYASICRPSGVKPIDFLASNAWNKIW